MGRLNQIVFVAIYILLFPLFFFWRLFQKKKIVNPSSEFLFGLHQHRVITEDKQWASVSFDIWRLWDTGISWTGIQPEQDKWDFTDIDKALKLAEQHNVQLIFNLGMSPKWAAKRPKDIGPYGGDITTSEPRDIEIWKHWVKTIAERCKGKVRYWEIWNEPDMPMFYTGSVKALALLTREASVVLKRVDPSNQVISPPITGYPILSAWLNRYLSLKTRNYIDIIGTHFYCWYKNNKPEDVKWTIDVINFYQWLNGFKKNTLPIWDTECSFRQYKMRGDKKVVLVDEEKQRDYLIRLHKFQKRIGVKCVCTYSWDNSMFVNMVGDDGKRNSVGDVYNTLYRVLK